MSEKVKLKKEMSAVVARNSQKTNKTKKNTHTDNV